MSKERVCACGDHFAGTGDACPVCAAESESSRTPPGQDWKPIDTAPTDGSMVWTYTASAHGLPAFESWCAYHPDAGWCTDELRSVTHWKDAPMIKRVVVALIAYWKLVSLPMSDAERQDEQTYSL